MEPPLNIQQVPLRQVELVSGVDVQSAEITDIVDIYLAEIVADATSREVMSEGLKAFLESPVGRDWDVVRELERQGSLSERERVRSVSLVRRALKNSNSIKL